MPSAAAIRVPALSQVALPLARFEPELLAEMQHSCPSLLEFAGEGKAQEIIIEHACRW